MMRWWWQWTKCKIPNKYINILHEPWSLDKTNSEGTGSSPDNDDAV